MSWIKRNLGFLAGSLVAVGLLAYGGYYLWTAYENEGTTAAQIESQVTELTTLNKQDPHPGNKKIDNVLAAKEQKTVIEDYIAKIRATFHRAPSIPGSAKVRDEDFAAQLRITVAQLNREAKDSGVEVPADYFYTFESERKLMRFDAGSLEKLAASLGEIKVICDVLFGAKVNALDRIRRESLSAQDQNTSDYLSEKTISTPLADLVPYEVQFHCFSAELASVLNSLANSPDGIIVKTVNVEPVSAADTATADAAAATAALALQQQQQMAREAYQRQQMNRYGPGFGAGGYGGGYNPQGFGRGPAPPPVAAPAPPSPKTFSVLVKEHQVKVSLILAVVRITPVDKPKGPEKPAARPPRRGPSPN